MTDTPTVSAKEKEKNRAQLIEDGKAVTGRISDACRLVGLGLLAIFYGIKTDDHSAFATSVQTGHRCLFYAIGALGLLSIVLDYVQYMFANISIEDAKMTEDQLYPKTFARTARTFCFNAKQLAVVAGSIALVWLVLVS